MTWKTAARWVIFGISAIFIAKGFEVSPFGKYLFQYWFVPVILGLIGMWYAQEKLKT